jgi:hypothetical protein
MFRYIRDPLFVVCTVLYVVNRWLVKLRPAVGEAFFRSYLNDLLLIPCALPPMLFLHRHLSLRPHDSFPTRGEVMLHLVVWSLYCEWVGPVIQHQGIGDPLDVLAYWIGGIGSWALWNRGALFHQGRKGGQEPFLYPPGATAGPNKALEPTPYSFGSASLCLRFWRRLTASVRCYADGKR